MVSAASTTSFQAVRVSSNLTTRSNARYELETGFAHYKIEPVTLYRGMVLMVAQRSPKPLVWVQVLVPLPYDIALRKIVYAEEY